MFKNLSMNVNISNSLFNEHDIDLNDENILVIEKTSIKAEGLQ